MISRGIAVNSLNFRSEIWRLSLNTSRPGGSEKISIKLVKLAPDSPYVSLKKAINNSFCFNIRPDAAIIAIVALINKKQMINMLHVAIDS